MPSDQPSAARSSRSSHRYSPYSRSSAPSRRPSPLPSQQHLHNTESHSSQRPLSGASDDQHPSIHSATLGSADNYFSPASATITPMPRQFPIPLPYSNPIYTILPSTSNQAYSHFPVLGPSPANRPSNNNVPSASLYSHSSTSNALLHPPTSHMTVCPPVPLFSDSQPHYTTQPYASTRQLEHLSYQYNQWLQPVQLSQPPFPYVPFHPSAATNIAHSGHTVSLPVDSLPNSQPFHAAQPSISVNGLEDATHQNDSVQQRPPQGQLSARQGQNYYSGGMFNNASNFSVPNGIFIDNSTTSDTFMREFLQYTIIGAEFDSSDRHPPPRCHPGTRLAIIKRCNTFIVQCDGEEKMRWVVGPAGVGKSAIMQMVAEENTADASVFFSVNGRQDGTKIFTTIAYQLAVKYQLYRQFIQKEISNDPTLLRKALPVQFRKFIVDPFIRLRLFDPSHRYLVIIDGLDECDNRLTQQEILGLISYFCLSYPASPIVWIIASRPEPHITAFFDDTKVTSAYTKEEILIDSDEACREVQRYLRDELAKIKKAYPSLKLKPAWPSELEFTKIADAAGGLFAYASTVVRYIGDPYYMDPAAQLCRILEVIYASLKDDVSGEHHPMAQLDALYRRILANIPPDTMINVRKLLSTTVSGWHGRVFRFRFQCNRLGLKENTAYRALHHLHAVVKVPTPDKADNEDLEFFHKSFSDFLCDRNRSGFSPRDEADQLVAQASLRIVQQVPDNFDGAISVRVVECPGFGFLKDDPGFCDNVFLSWPGDERFQLTDDQLRINLYREAIGDMCSLFKHRGNVYRTMSWFRVLTTRFRRRYANFPFYALRDCTFEHLCPKLMELGWLKEVPLRALDYAAIRGSIDLQFTSPIGMDVDLTDPWNLSCKHEWHDLELQRGWSTSFRRLHPDYDVYGDRDDVAETDDIPWPYIEAGKGYDILAVGDSRYKGCLHCLRRLACHFIDNPDQVATVFTDSAQMNYVEVSFQDPDDGVSEWRYRFCHPGPFMC